MVRNQSDHAPILISTMGFSFQLAGAKPFKFQVALLFHNGFDEVVRQAWRPKNRVNEALRDLVDQLNIWNKEVFGNLFRRKCELWRRLEGIQKRLADGGSWYLLEIAQETSW